MVRTMAGYAATFTLLFTMACSGGSSDGNDLGAAGAGSGEEVEPFDAGCTDEVCHIVLRLNAITLKVLGYAVAGAELSPVSPAQALEFAQPLFDDNIGLPVSVTLEGPEGGMYTASAPANDFGGVALIGEETGIAVVAGGIVWSGRGSYWTPVEWRSASDVQIGSSAVTAGGSHGQGGVCADVASSADALEVALKSNLAAHFAAVGNFDSLTYLYTPAVGVLSADGCEPKVAEYLVVLTQTEQPE